MPENETQIQKLIEYIVTNSLGYEPLRQKTDYFLDGKSGLKIHLCEMDSKTDAANYTIYWGNWIRPYSYKQSLFGRAGIIFDIQSK